MTPLPLSIAPDHPAFEGHFPSRPIVPGVVLLDESLRAIATHFRTAPAGSAACRIGAAKFLSMVRPGESLRLEVEPTSAPSGEGYRLKVFAGEPGHERLALNGTVSFEAATIPAAAT